MKKSLGFLFVVLMIFSSLEFVLAEGDIVDAGTQTEVEAIHSNVGANMRLLQLRYEIERRLVNMDRVVNYLDDNGKDTSELKGVIEELKLLDEELKSYVVGNLDDAIDKFISVKKDAISLIADFKVKAGVLLSEEDKTSLKSSLGNSEDEELNQLKEQFQQQKREYNAERVRNLLQVMGVEDEALVQQVRNGEVTVAQARQKLKENYDNSDRAKREQFKTQLKEEIKTRVQSVRASVEDYGKNVVANTASRIQARADKLKESSTAYAKERADKIRSRING